MGIAIGVPVGENEGMTRTGWVIALLMLGSCDARSDRDAAPHDSATPASASASAPRVLGSCCPDTDSELTALMQRYETTTERERSPELALWPYRMTSGMREQERIVVRDSATWAGLWPRIVGSHSPRPMLPAVSFATEMLLVVSMGTRGSGGYVIAIDSVATAGDTIRAVVREQSPGARCGTPAVLSAAVALARIERREQPVTFTTREVVRECS